MDVNGQQVDGRTADVMNLEPLRDKFTAFGARAEQVDGHDLAAMRAALATPHDDGPLGDGDLEGYNIVCPRHGAEFDVKTGKAVQLPAAVDIPAYPVRVKDGTIYLGMPKTGR